MRRQTPPWCALVPIMSMSMTQMYIMSVLYLPYPLPSTIRVHSHILNRIFTRNSDFLKWGGFWHNRGGAVLLLSVTDPKRHRTMRAAMNPFFSKGAADRASAGFVRRLNSASDIISQQSGERKSIDLVNVIRSLTVCGISAGRISCTKFE